MIQTAPIFVATLVLLLNALSTRAEADPVASKEAPSAVPVISTDVPVKLDNKPKAPAKPADPQLVPTHANVPYGTHERQVLDFWQAKSERPAPLLFFIHGGGWVAGDKNSVGPKIQTMLDAGISVVSINYRYSWQAQLAGEGTTGGRSACASIRAQQGGRVEHRQITHRRKRRQCWRLLVIVARISQGHGRSK